MRRAGTRPDDPDVQMRSSSDSEVCNQDCWSVTCVRPDLSDSGFNSRSGLSSPAVPSAPETLLHAAGPSCSRIPSGSPDSPALHVAFSKRKFFPPSGEVEDGMRRKRQCISDMEVWTRPEDGPHVHCHEKVLFSYLVGWKDIPKERVSAGVEVRDDSLSSSFIPWPQIQHWRQSYFNNKLWLMNLNFIHDFWPLLSKAQSCVCVCVTSHCSQSMWLHTHWANVFTHSWRRDKNTHVYFCQSADVMMNNNVWRGQAGFTGVCLSKGELFLHPKVFCRDSKRRSVIWNTL